VAVDAVVLLGSRWSELEGHHTRWRAVVERWRADARIGRLAVVDFPDFGLGRATLRAATPPPASWLEGVASVRVGVPADPAGRWSRMDRFTWWITARRLRGALGWSPGLVVAATPLWVPVVPRLGGIGAFDAVDDWRAFAPVAALATHVKAGYRAARRLGVVTTPSATLATRLAEDFGVEATIVPNGVDLARFSSPDATAPAGLPPGPFAVYAGVVEERVDVDLLASLVAAGITVVVAGPGSEALRGRGVHALGPIAPALVPGLLQAAAVGLVPHRVNALTASMDPLKTLEYLAAGLPVVSTSVPGSDLSPRIAVAADTAAFVAATTAALSLGRASSPDPAVAGRDWSVVADRLLTTYLDPSVLTAPHRRYRRWGAVKTARGAGR
jgi:teichuronic acid biosynthesis glycosyltransferase TuaH